MSDTQLWYAGLPVTGSRALSDAEVAELDAKIRDLIRETVGGIGLLLLAIAASSAVVVLALSLPLVGLIAYGIARMLPVVLPIVRITSPARFGAFRRDRKAGLVNICADGIVEVLPDSELVWRQHGAAPQKTTYYPRTATAPAPPSAAAAANFVRQVNDNVFLHQRPLTFEEREELAGYHPRPALPMFLLPFVAAAGAVITYLRAMTDADVHDLFVPFAFAVITFWSARTTYRQWTAWRHLAPDVEQATVLIVRLQEDGALGPPEEYLAHSRLLWTEDGFPALWRRTLPPR